ncbi:protein containing GCN5-related N-acetyltransferase domain protein [gut metagenome]|uniref:Protein containing GCN5-related N-acetyltransferase domain protein n=1 Tax=gut metagenome TaxID=749906 RepID=J9GHV9_9ZZZZ
MAENINIRMAQQDDAEVVASVLTEVSEGVIEHLLGGLLPGMSPAKILEMVLSRGSGNLDLKHVLLVEVDQKLGGLLFAYDAREQTVSSVMEGFLGTRKVDELRPLLEAKVDEALWINTFWVHEDFRGLGLAQMLMSLAEDWGSGIPGSSVWHCTVGLIIFGPNGFMLLSILNKRA